MTAKKLKIGVFFGGSSSEKEVSLEGGRNVYQQLDSAKYDKIPIFVDSNHRFWLIPDTLTVQNTCQDLQALLTDQAQAVKYQDLKNLIDFAFIIGHGKFMEDGALQGLMELLKIPYNGSGVLGSALGSNKFVQRQILESSGIDVPKYYHITAENWQKNKQKIIQEVENKISYPCVVKPTCEGCSTSITIADKPDKLEQGIESALQWDNDALIEELLKGREITVSVLGNQKKQVLPITETPPGGPQQKYLTLEDKFLPGGAEMITPADLREQTKKQVEETALIVCDILNLIGYPRIDMFISQDKRIVVLEPNTLPGITPSTMIFHQAAEIELTPAMYLDKIIELGLKAHQHKKGPL